MDRFDRVFCWFMSVLACGLSGLLLIHSHRPQDVLMIGSVCFLLVRWTWTDIPQRSRELKISAAICGHQTRSFVCVLEPEHPGNHKQFRSNGEVIAWLQGKKGGMMSQEERKSKAVLSAAREWLKAVGGTAEGQAADEKLATAIEEYEAVLKTPTVLDPAGDPLAFHCPHCGAPRPSYGWHFNVGDTGPFALQWITCFCGECKKVLSVSVVQFLPKAELVEMLKKQFSGKLVV